MYISELDLHGFKSFAHKTKVKFDSGITAIVGPNGCGKSNIVDALRWVLGEQRPSLLRSASMSNVIFNGTARKKALGMAEVSLSLINNRGVLPTEYSEVTITRRLFRSGDSEYLLNHTACRLKDIMELFMDTGMGSDAYSVIELKMVEEILNDRNNDRRRLFEEAAGVTRYKEKRKQALRKLDETRKDLQRIDDILQEVRKNVRSLGVQAEKAVKSKTLRSELEQLDKAFTKYEYQNVQNELQPLKERVEHADKEKKEISFELERLEEQDDASRRRLIEKERSEAETRKRLHQLDHTVRELETTLRITKEKITSEQGVIRQYKEDIQQGTRDLEELTKARQNSVEKRDHFSRDFHQSEESLKEARNRFNQVQQEYSEIRQQISEQENETRDLNGKLSDLQTKKIRLESRLENTEDDLARILTNIEDLDRQILNLAEEKDDVEATVNRLKDQKRSQDSKIRETEEKKQNLEADREILREELRELKSRRDSLASEMEFIRELSESREFFPSSVAWLLEKHADKFPNITTVSEVLQTDEAHATALEAALGEAINYVIVERLEDAIQASELLKSEKKGRATFIPRSELKEKYPSEKHSILQVVRPAKGYEALASLLLGSVLLAEGIQQAGHRLEQGGTAAVTPDGDLITGNRFLRSGSKSNQSGVRLGLKDKLKKLQEKLGQVETGLSKKEEDLQSLASDLDRLDLEKLRRVRQETDTEIRKWEKQLNRIESSVQVYEKNIGELKNRKESLSTNEGSSKEELESLLPHEKELQQRLDELNQDSSKKGESLQELEDERAIAQNRFNDAQLKYQDLKNKTENLDKDIKRAESGLEGIQKRLQSRRDLTRESEEKIARFRGVIEETEIDLEQRHDQKAEVASELEVAQKACSKERGSIRELETNLKELRRRKEVNFELVHHLEMAREKLQMQAKKLSDHVWDTYGILMKQIESQETDFDSGETKGRISSLRQQIKQIGEVNPLAIDEFEEEKNRLEFLEEQIQDLQEAEEQLRQTIEEINETATQRFNETFEKIRSNFKTVFKTLFQEDDYCDLLIEQDVEDPLDAKIEIKANPSGKRPSGISQLSGGEKTLTAIALLFAIYLVKPSPFCVLDEVDAPLDDANIERFANMIRNFSEQTQFIIITHNKKTMSKAEMMYGVTMPETGVSRLVGVKLDEVVN